MDEKYLVPTKKARWAVGRRFGEKFFTLVEDSRLDDASEAALVLQALRIEPTEENLDQYFPIRKRKGRCPTLELLNIFAQAERAIRKEHGV